MTALQPVLIDGVLGPASDVVGQFSAVNPATRQPLPEVFPISGAGDIERALRAARRAQVDLAQATPEQLALFLEEFASAIEHNASELVRCAALETALPATPRLDKVELPRTTDQLRQCARAAVERSWRRVTIDTRAQLRSWFEPLSGAVLIFGPSNFPFAFNGIAGGDFAAAIAAGNPVIAKANLGHPHTTLCLARLAVQALQAAHLPPETVQMLYAVPEELGLAWVADARVGCTAFTGSRKSGLALKNAADAAGRPISLELSSINPIFVLPGALAERGSAIASELAAASCLGAGQFCTNPGVSVVCGPAAEAWVSDLKREFEARPAGTLLGAKSPEHIASSLHIWAAHGAQRVTGGSPLTTGGYQFENTLYRVDAQTWLQHARALQTEAFGTAHLIVVARDFAEVLQVAEALEGNLTASLYTHSATVDDAQYAQLAQVVGPKVGRLLNDKMPTGVAVSPAMQHGGPYPATGHPAFTAVGIPAALLRFVALRCYDNVRPERLPPELRDQNCTGQMWRSINGQWTQADVST